MKINLIVGAGQIGSRHLQGMLKWNGEQRIYVMDPSPESLSVASTRAQEVAHGHEVSFVTTLDEVPENLDLVIVATSANVREKVATTLLERFKITFLLLEKVLFQELAAYQRVADLIAKTNTKTWVNHPRRMVPGYADLSSKILEGTANRMYSATGNNWGLGCNGLHFIDLFCFLSKSRVANIKTDWLDKNIAPSKRSGFIEFTGVLTGELLNGDKFTIASYNENPGAITINVNTGRDQWLIQEAPNAKVFQFEINNRTEPNVSSFAIEFQSGFTTRVCEDLFVNGDTVLPSFAEATEAHLLFIKALLEFSNTINNKQETILPIT